MTTLTVTAKGQVTLRKDVLKHLGVTPGRKVVVDKLPDGRITLKAQASGHISEAFGLCKTRRSGPASVEEIKAAAAAGWAGKR